MENTLLKQAQTELESKIVPEAKENYDKIVVAGEMLAMGKKDGNSAMADIKTAKDPLDMVVKAVIGILHLLRKQAKGVMPVNAMVPAGMTLVFQGLDVAERVGVLKVTKDVLAKAVKMYISIVLQKLRITPEKLRGYMQQAHDIVNDPQKLSQMKAAYTKDQQLAQQKKAQPAQPSPQAPAQQPQPPASGGLLNQGR